MIEETPENNEEPTRPPMPIVPKVPNKKDAVRRLIEELKKPETGGRKQPEPPKRSPHRQA